MSWNVPDHSIHCSVQALGRDWLVTLTGGEVVMDHHIGAVSTAYRDKESKEWNVMTQSIPGHKEHVLTEAMALEAGQALNGNVTVVAGIHFDHLTKEQIALVVDEAWSCFREALSKQA